MRKKTVTAEYSEHLNARAQDVWQFIRWDNLESMLAGGFFVKVQYLQQLAIPGAQRQVTLADGSQILEELEIEEADSYRLVYRMIDPLPMPVSNYQGCVQIAPQGEADCIISFQSSCHLNGMTEAQWSELYHSMQAGNVVYFKSQLIRGSLT